MDFFRVTLSMVTVFGLLGLLYSIAGPAKRRVPRVLAESRAIWSRKFRVSASQDKSAHLQVLRRLNLTATHQLHLISTTEGDFLVCTHPHGCTLLKTSNSLAPINGPGAVPEPIGRYAN